MKKFPFPLLTLIFVFLFNLVNAQNPLININDSQQTDYHELSASEKAIHSIFDNAHRVRPFVVNRYLQSIDKCKINDNILLDLFEDKQYKVYIDKINVDINGTLSITAKFLDYNYGHCVISTANGISFIFISIPEKNEQYTVKRNPETNKLYLIELDVTKLDVLEGAPSLIMPTDNILNNNYFKELKDDIIEDVLTTATIDLMIVYTPAAKIWADNNEGGINNTIGAVMANSQLTLNNSNTDIAINLVHSAEINYIESGNSSTDLSRITSSADLYMNEVHTWRELYGADLVVFLAVVEDVGGVGWLLNNINGRSEIGFSLTRVQQASSSYTVIHEMGHNMGCHHHKEQNVQPGPTSWSNWPENTWSAGWRWTGNDGGKYCSVMTYTSGAYFADGINHVRVPYFSDPIIINQGLETGHANNGNNARTLREVKHAIAAYKTTALHCSGTPFPGNTLSSVNAACLGVNFNLNLENNVAASGITYQWQSSLNGISWDSISNATNATLSISQSVNTYYRCIVTCSTYPFPGTSSSVYVPMNESICYCTPPRSQNACNAMWITNVNTTGGLSNFSNNSTCTASSYTDFGSSHIASNTQLASTTMTFTSAGYPMAFSVWIDYNDNGVFETSERVIANNNQAQSLTVTDNFTVSASAIAGTHRMRVRGDYFSYGAPTEPCNALNAGETEDYGFTVIAQEPCYGTPVAGTANASLTTVYAGQLITLSLSGNTAASGLVFNWQSSPDNSNWTNILGATDITFTTAQTATTHYRCTVTCTNSGQTDNSASVMVAYNNSILITNGSVTLCSGNFYDSGGPSADYMDDENYTFTLTPSTAGALMSLTFNFFTSESNWDYFTIYNGVGTGGAILYGPSSGTLNIGTITANLTNNPTGSLTVKFTSDGSVVYSGWEAAINCIAACSGTPEPGNTVSSVSAACLGANFILSLQNNVAAIGITYQWQSSPNSVSWANISNATNATLSISQSEGTYYRCVVTCSAGSTTGTSSSVYVPMNGTTCYCIPPVSQSACNMWITNVNTTGGLTNFSNNSSCESTSYSNYSDSQIVSNLELSTTTMSFTSFGYPLAFSVWIDYNDNGVFETSERVIANNNQAQSLTVTDNFTIPVSAIAGTHRMRVRGDYFSYGAPTDPCNTLEYGETEDYSFTTGATGTGITNYQTYYLGQNYPNPFSQQTYIEYYLPKTGRATISIYNSLGMEVYVLVNELLSAGSYKTKWTPTAFPSGLYYYQLRTDDYKETKMLILQ